MEKFEQINKIGIEDKLPTFQDALYPQLPQFLQDAVLHANTNQERDMLLLGAITCISSCLPKVYGIYGDEKVYSNLYLFVTAPPSSGKGKLKLTKKIIDLIHKSLRDVYEKQNEEYKSLLAEWKKDKDLPEPSKPKKKILFIPANNSSTGMYQLLSENGGKGIIFETEGDTLTLALKTDYGNYSDGFRKAFQHETINYYRRTGEELVEIDSPRLSVVLSGTPNQVTTLIPSAEDGLFSRFIFYYLDLDSEWIDVFQNSASDKINLHYEELGKQFLNFHTFSGMGDEIKITLSDTQMASFKNFFSKQQSLYRMIKPDNYIATIRRLGLIAFRFMMIFTTLRFIDTPLALEDRECSDIDFENALKMVSILIPHSRKVFSKLKTEENKNYGYKNIKEQFLASLPKTFDRQGYLDIAEKYGINLKSADRYINKAVASNLLQRPRHNNYINTLIKDDEKVEDIKETKDIKNTDTSSPESSTSSESAES